MASVNMTVGNPTKHLVQYALPLILGNLFQLTYNAVDSIIAGRFIGKEALAATGTASPVMNIIILGISGICIGAGVLMSEFFGAGDWESLKKEMATMLLFGLFFSLLVVGIGICVTPSLLKILKGGMREIVKRSASRLATVRLTPSVATQPISMV